MHPVAEAHSTNAPTSHASPLIHRLPAPFATASPLRPVKTGPAVYRTLVYWCYVLVRTIVPLVCCRLFSQWTRVSSRGRRASLGQRCGLLFSVFFLCVTVALYLSCSTRSGRLLEKNDYVRKCEGDRSAKVRSKSYLEMPVILFTFRHFVTKYDYFG